MPSMLLRVKSVRQRGQRSPAVAAGSEPAASDTVVFADPPPADGADHENLERDGESAAPDVAPDGNGAVSKAAMAPPFDIMAPTKAAEEKKSTPTRRGSSKKRRRRRRKMLLKGKFGSSIKRAAAAAPWTATKRCALGGLGDGGRDGGDPATPPLTPSVTPVRRRGLGDDSLPPSAPLEWEDDCRPALAVVNVANRSFNVLSVLSSPVLPSAMENREGKDFYGGRAAVFEIMPVRPIQADLRHGGPEYSLKCVPLEPRKATRKKKGTDGNGSVTGETEGEGDGVGSEASGDDDGTVTSITTRAFEALEEGGEDRFEIERRVRAEIAALRTISHENVIQVLAFEFGVDSEGVMEIADDAAAGSDDDSCQSGSDGSREGTITIRDNDDTVISAMERSVDDFSAISAVTVATATTTLTSHHNPPLAYLLTPLLSLSLSEFVERSGPLRNSWILLHVLESIGSAMCAVHAAGYRHNDLTPDAVMLQYPHGEPIPKSKDLNAPLPKVVLSSFGAVTPGTVTCATKYEALKVRSYHRRRTPAAYRAPELWRAGRAAKSAVEQRSVGGRGTRFPTLTPATDAFSLGCVLFHAMFGRHAFGKKTEGGTQPERWIATVPCKSYKKVPDFFLKTSLCLMVENSEWRLKVRELMADVLPNGSLGDEETPHVRAVWMDYMGAPGMAKFENLTSAKLDPGAKKRVTIRPPPHEVQSGAAMGGAGPLGLPTRAPNASGAATKISAVPVLSPVPSLQEQPSNDVHKPSSNNVAGITGSIDLDVSFVVNEMPEEEEEEEDKEAARWKEGGKKGGGSSSFNLGQVHKRLEALHGEEEDEKVEESHQSSDTARGTFSPLVAIGLRAPPSEEEEKKGPFDDFFAAAMSAVAPPLWSRNAGRPPRPPRPPLRPPLTPALPSDSPSDEGAEIRGILSAIEEGVEGSRSIGGSKSICESMSNASEVPDRDRYIPIGEVGKTTSGDEGLIVDEGLSDEGLTNEDQVDSVAGDENAEGNAQDKFDADIMIVPSFPPDARRRLASSPRGVISNIHRPTPTKNELPRSSSAEDFSTHSLQDSGVWSTPHVKSAFELYNGESGAAAGAGHVVDGGAVERLRESMMAFTEKVGRELEAAAGAVSINKSHRGNRGSELATSPALTTGSVGSKKHKTPEWGLFEEDSDNDCHNESSSHHGEPPESVIKPSRDELQPPSNVAAAAAALAAEFTCSGKQPSSPKSIPLPSERQEKSDAGNASDPFQYVQLISSTEETEGEGTDSSSASLFPALESMPTDEERATMAMLYEESTVGSTPDTQVTLKVSVAGDLETCVKRTGARKLETSDKLDGPDNMDTTVEATPSGNMETAIREAGSETPPPQRPVVEEDRQPPSPLKATAFPPLLKKVDEVPTMLTVDVDFTEETEYSASTSPVSLATESSNSFDHSVRKKAHSSALTSPSRRTQRKPRRKKVKNLFARMGKRDVPFSVLENDDSGDEVEVVFSSRFSADLVGSLPRLVSMETRDETSGC